MTIEYLIKCCEDGNLERLKAYNGDIDTYISKLTPNGQTLLYICLKFGNIHCAEWLLEKGADITIRSNVSSTPDLPEVLEPIYITAFKSFETYGIKPVELIFLYMPQLLSNQQVVDMVVDSIALDGDIGELLRYVLKQYGGQVDLRKYEATLMSIPTFNRCHIKALREFKACIDLLELLRFSLVEHRIECFKMLLDHLRYPEMTNHVFTSAIGGHIRTSTLLSMCVKNGYLHESKMLLARGADINSITTDHTGTKMTPLMEVGSCITVSSRTNTLNDNRIECYKWLISVGCDVNYHDSNGESAISIASKRGSYESIKLLIDTGRCDVMVKDVNMKNPFDHIVDNYPFRSFGYICDDESNNLYLSSFTNFTRIFDLLKWNSRWDAIEHAHVITILNNYQADTEPRKQFHALLSSAI